ncbi:MAG: hypothetical protein M1127_00110 [Patescibacteria group bacterium]|nr:hypothetical protein [Patescibacteria group bacterium]
MKYILFFIFILIIVSQVATAIEFQEKIAPGPNTHTLTFSQAKNINSHLGVSGFALVSNGWAEAYMGPNVNLKPWLQAGCAIGVETHKHFLRVAGSILANKEGPVSFLAIYENGGSGIWYNIKGMAKVRKWLFLGIMAKRYAGVGPYVQVGLSKIPVSIWFHPAYDTESKKFKTTIGVVLN